MTEATDDSGEIILAGKPYPIEAPTLDELQALLPFAEAIGAAEGNMKLLAARSLVGHVIGKSNEELGGMKITPTELLDAVETIMYVAGLDALKNRKPATQAPAKATAAA